LLAWAVEDMDESLIANVIANWIGLEPEERWWLYTTVNATFTRAELGKDRGWRKAIRIAFSENPVPEIAGDRFVEEPEPVKLPQKDKDLKAETRDGGHDIELRSNSFRVPRSPAPKRKKQTQSNAKKQSNLFDE
ncbi:MAG: DUF3780 domain-containing protein, partial [Deltaproteobacteria bacterium]|nr:DUF3780 domain-containing protein [Deltaproteobacteria bacterium]